MFSEPLLKRIEIDIIFYEKYEIFPGKKGKILQDLKSKIDEIKANKDSQERNDLKLLHVIYNTAEKASQLEFYSLLHKLLLNIIYDVVENKKDLTVNSNALKGFLEEKRKKPKGFKLQSMTESLVNCYRSLKSGGLLLDNKCNEETKKYILQLEELDTLKKQKKQIKSLLTSETLETLPKEDFVLSIIILKKLLDIKFNIIDVNTKIKKNWLDDFDFKESYQSLYVVSHYKLGDSVNMSKIAVFGRDKVGKSYLVNALNNPLKQTAPFIGIFPPSEQRYVWSSLPDFGFLVYTSYADYQVTDTPNACFNDVINVNKEKELLWRWFKKNDVILFLLDIEDKDHEEILKKIYKKYNKPVIIVVPKIDKNVSHPAITSLQNLAEKYNTKLVFVANHVGTIETDEGIPWNTIGIKELLNTINEIIPKNKQLKINVNCDMSLESFIQNQQLHTKESIIFYKSYDKKGLTKFHHACLGNDIKELQRLITEGSDIQQLTKMGESALDIAVCHPEHTAVIKWLLQHDIEIRKKKIEDLYSCTKYTDVELISIVYPLVYSQYKELVNYLLFALNLEQWNFETVAIKPLKQFLQITFYVNKPLHSVFDYLLTQSDPLKALENYHPIYLISYIKNTLINSPEWEICLARIQTYSLENTQYFDTLRLYLDNALTEAIFGWYKILPDKTSLKLTSINQQKLESEQKIHAEALKADVQKKSSSSEVKNEPSERPHTYPSFPLNALNIILNLSQDFKVEEILANSEKSKEVKPDSWKRWFIESFIPPTTPGYDTLLGNFDWGVAKKILRSGYGRFRILESLRQGQIFNWQAMTGIEEILKARDELKNYLEAYKNKKSEIDYETLIMQLLKEQVLFDFLTDEKWQKARSYLAILCANAHIPGLDQTIVIAGFEIVANLQKLIRAQPPEIQSKITTYDTLGKYLLSKDAIGVFSILKQAFSFIEQFQQLITIFLQPQLAPMAKLLQPALQQALLNTKILWQEKQKNPQLKTNHIRTVALAKDKAFIDADKILEEEIIKEKLGDFLKSPTGEALVNRQWGGCVFIGETVKITDPENEIQGSFNHIYFIEYNFSGCIFRRFSFAEAYFICCDFTDAQFFDEVTLDMNLNLKSARSLLLALRKSLDNHSNTSRRLNIKGKIKILEESDEILDIYGEMTEYVHATKNVRFHKLNDTPLMNEDDLEDKPKTEKIPPVSSNSEQQQVQASWFSVLGSFLPTAESLQRINEQSTQAVQVAVNLIKKPFEMVVSLNNDSIVEADQSELEEKKLDESLVLLKAEGKKFKQKERELLQLKLRELETKMSQQNAAHVQTVSLVAIQQEKLQREMNIHHVVLAALQSEMADIKIYWQEKKRIAAEHQQFLNDPNPGIQIFYKYLLMHLGRAFETLLLLQNPLQLLSKKESGTVTNIAKRGGIFSATKVGKEFIDERGYEQLGFLGKIAEQMPDVITHAINALERGIDYTLIYAKKLLKLKEVVKSIPGIETTLAGQIVAGLKIAEIGTDFLLDKKDNSHLQAVENRLLGLTQKNIEKLAGALARAITTAYYHPISRLSEAGSRILACCGMMRIMVALLNRQLGVRDNFILEVLIVLRSFNVSQNNYGGIPNPFGIDLLRRPLPLADATCEDKITEDDIFRHVGICFIASNKINYYSNDPGRSKNEASTKSVITKANKTGYMLVSQQYWQEVFRYDVTPEHENKPRITANIKELEAFALKQNTKQATKETPNISLEKRIEDLERDKSIMINALNKICETAAEKDPLMKSTDKIFSAINQGREELKALSSSSKSLQAAPSNGNLRLNKPIVTKSTHSQIITQLGEDDVEKLAADVSTTKNHTNESGKKLVKTPTFNKSVQKTAETKGGGDCALHAVLGKWDDKGQQFVCADVTIRRQQVADAIQKCKPGDALFLLAQEAIKAIVMENRMVIGKRLKVAQENYQQYQQQDSTKITSAWESFEKDLKNYQDVLNYINQFVKKYCEARPNINLTLSSTLKLKFSTCLNEDETFSAILYSIPRLHEAHKKYHQECDQNFKWDEILNDPLIINEYAEFVKRPGQWLLPVELHILAIVFDVRVEFYTQSLNQKMTNPVRLDIYNEGSRKTAAICFNGINHYEQMVNDDELSLEQSNLKLKTFT